MHFPIELPAHILKMATRLNINPADIQEHFIHGHGHGGQKVNKTASCVQLIHTPTNTEIRCQAHREQHKNRAEAYTLLIEKLHEEQVTQQRIQDYEKHLERAQHHERSWGAKRKMVDDKKHRGEIKKGRGEGGQGD